MLSLVLLVFFTTFYTLPSHALFIGFMLREISNIFILYLQY